MKNTELLHYLSKFPAISPEERETIAGLIPVHTFRKGSILLRAGEVCTACYFILKGCIREYMLVDDEEKTTAFFTEEQAVVVFSSYNDQVPSDRFLSCVEDSTVMVGEFSREQAMYQQFPALEAITRKIVEQDYDKTRESFAAFITSSPEERYLHLLKTRPELAQRVPQHQLASYLGITPESLSRIRKRIATKRYAP
ncbi:Crp/Fnr family transcriptional regulator [Chitinophaga alhagiae]|uniref:Crp/Fnr family transcriptional regulator n=1 Tax=Chitinophaga alhagiae TaxID=2203219 RepID=UPI000E5B295C|nr:Crp/Fnr family transcriptional regulator [Chitinophaga alhagiae]